jgi:transketolase
MESLRPIANRIRGKLVELSHAAGTPHLGSALSCVDILVAAYWRVLSIDPKNSCDPGRDRLILSKGHAATALYATLAERGFFVPDLLDSFAKGGSVLAEQPSPGCAAGVEWATGSLGHGLPVAVGMALAGRLSESAARYFVVVSDGECEEGSLWEAALFAAAQKLDRLTVIVDYNKWQATGRSDEVMSLAPLGQKWKSFGWDAVDADGHDIEALAQLMARGSGGGKPFAIVANTVKGKGVSFMEDDNNWHYRSPTADEVKAARTELGLA